MSVKPIALYLPQFHPIPENDEYWGKGFTEWTNVTKAKPRFEGHYQPHLPKDLGFYDLRLEETRLAQEALAKQYGLHGFCYYHYWFNGKRVLYEPLDRKLQNPKENLPFMLCWANENWTKAWDGSADEVLLKQNYSIDDDREHIKYLLNIFRDERYIKVNGKPFFIFYKPDLFPDMAKTIEVFREEGNKIGMELYLGSFERWIGMDKQEMQQLDFDAIIEFQPLSKSMQMFKTQKEPNILKPNLVDKLRNKMIKRKMKVSTDFVVDYKEFIDFDLKYKNDGVYPCVCPMWDNSSRRVGQNAIMFKDSTPEDFKFWFQHKINKSNFKNLDEKFIFINAWNEWAEGNHLEPCEKWGHKYLEAIV